jgi:hypothetical protein
VEAVQVAVFRAKIAMLLTATVTLEVEVGELMRESN